MNQPSTVVFPTAATYVQDVVADVMHQREGADGIADDEATFVTGAEWRRANSLDEDGMDEDDEDITTELRKFAGGCASPSAMHNQPPRPASQARCTPSTEFGTCPGSLRSTPCPGASVRSTPQLGYAQAASSPPTPIPGSSLAPHTGGTASGPALALWDPGHSRAQTPSSPSATCSPQFGSAGVRDFHGPSSLRSGKTVYDFGRGTEEPEQWPLDRACECQQRQQDNFEAGADFVAVGRRRRASAPEASAPIARWIAEAEPILPSRPPPLPPTSPQSPPPAPPAEQPVVAAGRDEFLARLTARQFVTSIVLGAVLSRASPSAPATVTASAPPSVSASTSVLVSPSTSPTPPTVAPGVASQLIPGFAEAALDDQDEVRQAWLPLPSDDAAKASAALAEETAAVECTPEPFEPGQEEDCPEPIFIEAGVGLRRGSSPGATQVLDDATCSFSGSGTGFVVGPSAIVTATSVSFGDGHCEKYVEHQPNPGWASHARPSSCAWEELVQQLPTPGQPQGQVPQSWAGGSSLEGLDANPFRLGSGATEATPGVLPLVGLSGQSPCWPSQHIIVSSTATASEDFAVTNPDEDVGVERIELSTSCTAWDSRKVSGSSAVSATSSTSMSDCVTRTRSSPLATFTRTNGKKTSPVPPLPSSAGRRRGGGRPVTRSSTAASRLNAGRPAELQDDEPVVAFSPSSPVASSRTRRATVIIATPTAPLAPKTGKPSGRRHSQFRKPDVPSVRKDVPDPSVSTVAEVEEEDELAEDVLDTEVLASSAGTTSLSANMQDFELCENSYAAGSLNNPHLAIAAWESHGQAHAYSAAVSAWASTVPCDYGVYSQGWPHQAQHYQQSQQQLQEQEQQWHQHQLHQQQVHQQLEPYTPASAELQAELTGDGLGQMLAGPHYSDFFSPARSISVGIDDATALFLTAALSSLSMSQQPEEQTYEEDVQDDLAASEEEVISESVMKHRSEDWQRPWQMNMSQNRNEFNNQEDVIIVKTKPGVSGMLAQQPAPAPAEAAAAAADAAAAAAGASAVLAGPEGRSAALVIPCPSSSSVQGRAISKAMACLLF